MHTPSLSNDMTISNFLKYLENIKKRLEQQPNLPQYWQKGDVNRFIRLIESLPFSKAITVGELKKIIKEERELLKSNIKKSQPEGHQYTIFEEPRDTLIVSIAVYEMWQKEVKFLHRCLGMCANPKYFD